jgi:tRNA1(Val) A37 N6-methylase TrmN6
MEVNNLNYRCEKCGKEFLQKAKYIAHNKRKTPCIKELKNNITQDDYSKLSKTLTRQLDKNDKKNEGIYFTPPKTIHHNLEQLDEFMSNIQNVLEPSCGSCEYILALNRKYPELSITGIELNETIYQTIKPLENDKITIINDNYLLFQETFKYDLIIGNPPYFVMSKNDVDSKYYEYFDGRPNIFILFIIKSLRLLNRNGILSFVLPKNFLNCSYYNKTRQYIFENFNIINIINCDDNYLETKQDTIILILQKKINSRNELFSLFNDENIIFGTPNDINQLKLLYENSTTLSKLNFNVSVGNIVWNQCKEQLTDDNTKTLLIYSSDIKNNTLSIQQYSNEEKKNYINRQGNTNPLLVINRGYGVGKYKFEYCLIDGGTEYLIENHLICIKYNSPIENNELIHLYQKIIQSFNNQKTMEFIQLYFGNNAINTSELKNILPIYID